MMLLAFLGRASLVAQSVKNLLAMQENGFDSQVGKIPWRRKWLPTPVFLPGKSHGQRSLAGHSPWGHKSQTPWIPESRRQLSDYATTTTTCLDSVVISSRKSLLNFPPAPPLQRPNRSLHSSVLVILLLCTIVISFVYISRVKYLFTQELGINFVNLSSQPSGKIFPPQEILSKCFLNE